MIAGGKVPTIISPKQYKRRFRYAIWMYFNMVPRKDMRFLNDYADLKVDLQQAALRREEELKEKEAEKALAEDEDE